MHAAQCGTLVHIFEHEANVLTLNVGYTLGDRCVWVVAGVLVHVGAVDVESLHFTVVAVFLNLHRHVARECAVGENLHRAQCEVAVVGLYVECGFFVSDFSR